MARQLPTAIVRHILHYLHPLPFQQAPRDTPSIPIHEEATLVSNLRAIQQCMLVSKTFYLIARPILFSKITLTHQARTVEDDPFCLRLYQDVFLPKPEVAAEVQEVEINFISEDSGHNHNPDSDSDTDDGEGSARPDSGHHHRDGSSDHSDMNHHHEHNRPPPRVDLEQKREEAFRVSGNRAWTGIVGVLDMIAAAAAASASSAPSQLPSTSPSSAHGTGAGSAKGIKRLVLKGLIDYDDSYCDLRTLDDAVIVSLVGLRTSSTLRSLVLIHINNPHPALVFGDVPGDRLEVLDIHCGSFLESGQAGTWQGRLITLEMAPPVVRRAVEPWLGGWDATAQPVEVRGKGALSAVRVLSFTHGSFVGCVKIAEKVLGSKSLQRVKRLRLPRETEEKYDQAEHTDFVKGFCNAIQHLEVENERGWATVAPLMSKAIFPNLSQIAAIVHIQDTESVPAQLRELKDLLNSFQRVLPSLHPLGISLLQIKIIIFLKSSDAGIFNRFFNSSQWNQMQKQLVGLPKVEADLVTVSSLSNFFVLSLLRMDDPESFLPADLKEYPANRHLVELGGIGQLGLCARVESGRRVRWSI